MSKFKHFFVAFALFCLSTMAANSQTTGHGTILGTSINWTLSKNDVLIISGNGQMPDWVSTEVRPWQKHVANIKTIAIDAGITHIGNYAFFNHNNVTSVSIGNNVTVIGEYAFAGCIGLDSVVIPGNVIKIGYRAFTGSGLTGIVIPNNVKTLGIGVFEGCKQMTSAHIGSGITRIPDGLFQNSGLTEITIPEHIVNLGFYTFRNSDRLATVFINAVNLEGYTYMVQNLPFYDCAALTTVVFGDKVEQIPEHLFTSHPSIKSLKISSNVSKINRYAFFGCSGLTQIVIPDGVHTISASAFAECTGVTSIELGSDLSEIAASAFTKSRIKSIIIPKGITNIGGSAFRGSSRLETIYFDARNCTDFISTNYHFADCPMLESVVFGDNVRRIPEHVLSGLSSLELVTIGSRVTTIGDNAFENCSGLVEIINQAAKPQTINANVFARVDKTACTLKVSAESKNAYRAALVWKDFLIVTQ